MNSILHVSRRKIDSALVMCGSMLLAASCLLFAACGKAKDQAAVAIDEARLNVASARKAAAKVGEEPVALIQARAHLDRAERDFKAGRWEPARVSSENASAAARKAKAEPPEQTAPAKSKPAAKKTSRSSLQNKRATVKQASRR